MFESKYNSGEGTITVTLSGRMDILASTKLNEIMKNDAVLGGIKPGDKVIFDLSQVDYVASSFIRICVQYARAVGSERFSVANCQPFVKKTFKISGLDAVLNIKE